MIPLSRGSDYLNTLEIQGLPTLALLGVFPRTIRPFECLALNMNFIGMPSFKTRQSPTSGVMFSSKTILGLSDQAVNDTFYDGLF